MKLMMPAISKTLALSACIALMACTQVAAPPSSAQIESAGMLAQGTHQTAAIAQLTAWAGQGSPVAQRELALTYLNWPGHEADAQSWMLSAAKGGDAESQFILAEALFKGTCGFQADHAQAWAWYEKAALQGNGKAGFMLARMAKYGDGTTQSLQQSTHWLIESSKAGNAQAMFLLSNAYSAGDGVARDEAKAREWLEKSAAGDYPVAIQALALSLDGRDAKSADQGAADATRARLLLKEASDERLMHWRGYQ